MNLKNENGYTYYESICKNKNAKNIVFVHGFATTSDYHDGFLKAVENKYNYYAIQLPGHGNAKLESKKQLTPYNFALHVGNWIKFMKFEKIYLIGHSMGGGIVNMVAAMFPEHIEKLVMVTPMNPSFAWKHLNVLKFLPKDNKETFEMQKMIISNVTRFYENENDPKIIKETEYQLENRKAFLYLRRKMMSVSNMMHLISSAKKNKIKTLVIVGKLDDVIYWKSCANYFKKFSNYKIEVFQESSHLPFWEEYQKYCEVVLKFLEG